MSRLELLLEAERRGLLPPDKRALLQEARRRGLVPGEEEETIAPITAAEPELTLGGYAKEALKGLIPGAAGLAETAITGAASILPDEAEQAVRERVSGVVEPIREYFAPAPGYEDTAVRKLSEAVGSTLPFLPLGALGAAGRAAAVGLGVGAGAGESRLRAEEEGTTEEERGVATALGTVPGALEAYAPIRILRRLGFGDEAVKEVAGFVPALRRAAQAGGEEGLMEASSQVLQNLIAKGVYAPDEAVFGGVGEAAALGGGAGAIVSAIADLALGRRLRGRGEEAPAEERPAETPLEELPPSEAAVAPEEVVPLTDEERRDALERRARELRALSQPVTQLGQEPTQEAVYQPRRPLGDEDQMGLPLEGGAAQLDMFAPTESGQAEQGIYRPAEEALEGLRPRSRAFREEAKDLGLKLDRKGNLKPNQFVPEITSQVSPDQESFTFEEQKELPLTLPAPLTGQGDMFAEGVPLPTRGQPRTDITGNSQVSWLPETEGVSEEAPKGQFALDLPGIPMERLVPRDRVLRAMAITEDKKNIPNLRFATQLRPMELQKTIGDLKNEGAIAFNKSANEWELTPAGVENVRTGSSKTKPPRRRRGPRVSVPPQGAEGPNVTGVGERGVAGAGESPARVDVREEPSVPALARKPSDELFDEIQGLREQALSMLVGKYGKRPIEGSPRRKQYDALQTRIAELTGQWGRQVAKEKTTAAPSETAAPSVDRMALIRRAAEKQVARTAIDETTQRRTTLRTQAIDAFDADQINEATYTIVTDELKKPVPNFAKVTSLLEGTAKPKRQGVGLKFQQGEVPATPQVTFERVQAAADDAIRSWTNAPKVVVASSVDDPVIPEPLRKQVPKDAPGFYIDGTTYVLADRAKDEAAVRGTVFHESLGHYGLEQEFQGGLQGIMQGIYDTNPKMREAANVRMKKFDLDAPTAVEEVLAERSETGPIKESWLRGAYSRVAAYVRNFMRQRGLVSTYSDNDVSQILRQAHRRVTKLKKTSYDPFDPAIRYQRSPEAQRRGDIAFINSLGKISQNFPAATKETYESARNAASNIPSSLRSGLFSMLDPHEVGRMYSRQIKSDALENLWKTANQEGADLRKMQDTIMQNMTKWTKVMDKYTPAEQEKIYNLFMDTTTTKIKRQYVDAKGRAKEREEFGVEVLDFSDPSRNVDWKADVDHPLYKQLSVVFQRDPAVKELYKDLRLAYTDYSLAIEKILQQYLTPNEWQKILNKLNERRVRVYLPLFRQGEFKLKYVDKEGNPVSLQFETRRERDLAEKEILREGIMPNTRPIKSLVGEKGGRELPPTGFFADVIATLQTKGVDKETQSLVFEHFLDYLPANSVLQRGRRREGTAGYSKNVLNVYANVADSYARRVLNMQFAPKYVELQQRFTEDLNAAKDRGDIADGVADDLETYVQKYMDFTRNPNLNNWGAKLGYWSFQLYLGANISTAVTNVFDTPTVMLSRLLGKGHKIGSVGNALLKASGVYFSKQKSPEMQELLRRGLNTGILREQRLQDIAEFKNLDSRIEKIKAGVDRFTTYAFAKSDIFNREVGLIAAYDLQKAKNKTPPGVFDQNAFDVAESVVADVYGSSFPKAAAPIMGSDIAKTALTFKRFGIKRMHLLAAAYREAAKDLDPNDPDSKIIRDAARNELIGYFGTAFLVSGVQGMPVVGAAMGLVTILNGILGDDDEPYNPDFQLREAIGLFNYKGPINYLIGIDIASRTGWTGMFWREDPKRMAEVGPVTYIMEQLMGPTYSYAVGVPRAYDYMKEGNYQRAFEQIMPRSVANISKGFRYGTEGALTAKGVPLVGDVSAYNAFMQIFGFRPSDVAEAGDIAGATKQMESKILQRRNAIIARAAVARMSGDIEGFQAAIEDAQSFSQKYPARAITADTLYGAIERRQKKMVESVNGVRVDPKLARSIYEELGIEPE
jgi:hypothetical protein